MPNYPHLYLIIHAKDTILYIEQCIMITKANVTSKVDVDPQSFEFIHDKPPLPRQSK